MTTHEQLDTVSGYETAQGMDLVILQQRYKMFERFYFGKSCIEIGCADGGGTQFLVKHFDRVVAVDGSKVMLEKLAAHLDADNLETVHTLFEELDLGDETFDTIVLSHILEHVDDPVQILKIAAGLAHENSVIIVDVPNARSFHRQIGVEMGFLNTVYDLSERDIEIGHQRVYDLDLFTKDIEGAGLSVIDRGGIFLKFMSNAQTWDYLQSLSDDMRDKAIQALTTVGEKHGDSAAEIYVICKKLS